MKKKMKKGRARDTNRPLYITCSDRTFSTFGEGGNALARPQQRRKSARTDGYWLIRVCILDIIPSAVTLFDYEHTVLRLVAQHYSYFMLISTDERGWWHISKSSASLSTYHLVILHFCAMLHSNKTLQNHIASCHWRSDVRAENVFVVSS